MIVIRKERSFENFLNDKIKNLSDATKENIIYSNRVFNKFLQENYHKTTDEVIAEAKVDDEPDEVILEVFQAWINSRSDKLSYSALRVYASGINRYLKYQKMKIDLTDIEWPAKLQEERYAISPNEIEKIMDIASFNRKGYYLALISSGARPAEVLGLGLSDIELLNGKYKALIPAHLTKKKMARTVFFSGEVTPYLNYLQKSLYPKGENMIKKQCTVNSNLTDLYTIDEFGNEKLVFCSNTGEWEN